MAAIIYRLTNTTNGKTYIGLTTKSLAHRWRNHCYTADHNPRYHLHLAIRKYGKDAFTQEILEETTIELVNDRERYWIAELQPEYNMTHGGEGTLGWIPSTATRQKLREAKLGKRASTETRIKQSAAHRGLKHSPETRIKISQMHRGKTVSSETRRKLSVSRIGTPAYNKKDLSGRVFGQWTVLTQSDSTKAQKLQWTCQCSCGAVAVVVGANLISGRSTKCKSCSGRQNVRTRWRSTSTGLPPSVQSNTRAC